MDRVMDSDKDTQRDLEGLPKHIALFAALGDVAASLTYQMKPSDTVLIVDTTLAGGDDVAIVTLPSLAEAVGKFYFIVAPVGHSAYHLSLYEKETGAELATNGDMDADDDHLILFSDGAVWRTVLDGVA